MKDTHTLSRIVLPLAVIFASFSAIFIRWSNAPALIIAFYRMLIAFLLVLPYSLAKPEQVYRRDLLLSVVSGVFLGIHFATWISSLHYTS
ncbi:MAG TPA: EamA/RhaT family transporter, partial [Clostridia bacterium]|nr:EamA/RhaT family transporter [Clostridia bacterium]